MTYKQELDQLRLDINQADKEIILAISKRLEIVKKIGRLKKKNNIEPLDESRWQFVIEMVTKLAQANGLNPKPVIEIYKILHMHALKIES